MALVDTYRSNVQRKRTELSKLIENRGKENSKIHQQQQKISSAKDAISRTKSQSTVKSKLSEISRAEKEISSIYKKLGDFDKKISQKEKEITSENSKLLKEEERLRKQQETAEKRRLQENERRMTELMNKPTTQYNNYGGQMNVAHDNSTINATYNHYESEPELDVLINKIKDSDLSAFTEDEQEVLIDNIDILQEQLSSDEPKKGFVKTAIAGLSLLIHKSAELTEPLQQLIEFAKNHINII